MDAGRKPSLRTWNPGGTVGKTVDAADEELGTDAQSQEHFLQYYELENTFSPRCGAAVMSI